MNFNPFKIYRIHFLWFICWVPIGAFDTTINNYVVPKGCTERPLLFEGFFHSRSAFVSCHIRVTQIWTKLIIWHHYPCSFAKAKFEVKVVLFKDASQGVSCGRKLGSIKSVPCYSQNSLCWSIFKLGFQHFIKDLNLCSCSRWCMFQQLYLSETGTGFLNYFCISEWSVVNST